MLFCDESGNRLVVYIDLNLSREGIVSRPEEYRYNSLAILEIRLPY